jgi:hypothetical protein
MLRQGQLPGCTVFWIGVSKPTPVGVGSPVNPNERGLFLRLETERGGLGFIDMLRSVC